jgi:hypothetical protein
MMQVILVAQSSLEAGFSRELFIQMASEPKNHVLFTSMVSLWHACTIIPAARCFAVLFIIVTHYHVAARPLAGSLGDIILRQKAAESSDPIVVGFVHRYDHEAAQPRVLKVPYKHRIKLQGEELAAYRQVERERLEAQKAEAMALLQNEQDLDEDEAGDGAAGMADEEVRSGHVAVSQIVTLIFPVIFVRQPMGLLWTRRSGVVKASSRHTSSSGR